MFELVAPIQVLYTLSSQVKVMTTGVELTSSTDVTLFNDLSRGTEKIKNSIKLFNKRSRRTITAGVDTGSESELDDS